MVVYHHFHLSQGINFPGNLQHNLINANLGYFLQFAWIKAILNVHISIIHVNAGEAISLEEKHLPISIISLYQFWADNRLIYALWKVIYWAGINVSITC